MWDHTKRSCMARLGAGLVIAVMGVVASARPVEAQLLGSLSDEEEIEVGREAARRDREGLDVAGGRPGDVLHHGARGASGRALPARARSPTRSRSSTHPRSTRSPCPGGFIYINRGLIEAADDESEVAGVLGHEIAHVVARHGAEQVRSARPTPTSGSACSGSILGRGTGAQIGGIAAEMAATGVFMKFGRDAEREADRLGARNVAAAGLDPAGMITFFEKLAALRESRPNAVERFFASHPEPAERIENIQDLVDSLGGDARHQDVSSGRFAVVKARLAELPCVPRGGCGRPRPGAATPDAVAETADPTGPGPGAGPLRGRRRGSRGRGALRPGVSTGARARAPATTTSPGSTSTGTGGVTTTRRTRRTSPFPLAASIYFNVSETETHYFLHYAAFHPRDYKGGNVRGVILSELLREGAARHGDHDPTGLAESAVLAHENDMEGALVVVQKATGRVDRARVVYVETLAHNQFLQYRAGGDELVLEDERPVLYVSRRDTVSRPTTVATSSRARAGPRPTTTRGAARPRSVAVERRSVTTSCR